MATLPERAPHGSLPAELAAHRLRQPVVENVVGELVDADAAAAVVVFGEPQEVLFAAGTEEPARQHPDRGKRKKQVPTGIPHTFALPHLAEPNRPRHIILR